jgi:saccharopine dehydrogenase-like NADP-dependent oxidoreductase
VSGVVLVGPPEQEHELSRLVAILDPRAMGAAVPFTVEGVAQAFGGLDLALACLERGEASGRGNSEGGIEHELTAFEAAVATGIPYVSSTEDPGTIEAMLAKRAGTGEATGVAVPGMSWTPGLSNLLVRTASEQLDTIDSIRIAWTVSRRDEGADLSRLLATWSGDAEVIEAGQRRLRPAGSRPDRRFFPQPVGWQRVGLARGAEILTLPETVGDVESFHVEAGMDGISATSLARATARPSRAASTGRAARPSLGGLTRSVAAALRPSATRPSGWSALRVDVEGTYAGTARIETYGIVDHLVNLETAPLVVAGVLAARGEVQAHGVAPPESAFEPARFLATLAERGVRAARLERGDLSAERATLRLQR